jgi:hypothetical protein
MKQWFYYEQGKQTGPISEDRLIQMFQSGQLQADTYVWTEGMKDWRPAGDFEQFLPGKVTLPPPPKAPPAPPIQQYASTSGPMFLHISHERLVFMSIIAIGWYQAYWFFKNWQYLKIRDGLKIMPFWRGLFGIFFCHKLFRSIKDDQQANTLERAVFPANYLATGWVLCFVINIVLGGFQSLGTTLLSLFIGILALLFFVPVQEYINRVNAKMNRKPRFYAWSTGHTVCLIAGIFNWTFIIAGMMLWE